MFLIQVVKAFIKNYKHIFFSNFYLWTNNLGPLEFSMILKTASLFAFAIVSKIIFEAKQRLTVSLNT